MRAYADTSYLVKLLTRERGSDLAVAEYRHLRRPQLFFLPLHILEVENAIRQKAFHLRRSLPSGERAQVAREKTSALARLERMQERGVLVDVAADWDDAMRRARNLSERFTESTGARSFDLLHVAFALELNCELFLTTDDCQARVARAAGLKVVAVADES